MTSKIKINFLGTADAIPSKNRNHLAVLLTFEGENILFDCGEGTQRQLRKANLNPCKLTKILISHTHADHVLGLVGILETLNLSGYSKKLEIFGPRGIKEFLKDLFETFRVNLNYELEIKEVFGKFFENKDFYLSAERMEHGSSCNAYSFVMKDKLKIDKSKLKKFKIPSGKHLSEISQGRDIVFEGKKFKAKDLVYSEKGKKVSYVVDTLMNSRIQDFVDRSDVFICEGTFSKEEEAMAREKKHLTFEQAGKIAKDAKVGKLFLVHIGQRYSRCMKEVEKSVKKIFKNSFLPRDLDVVEL